MTEKESWQIEKYLNYIDGGFRWFDLLSFLIFFPYFYFLQIYSLAVSIQISFMIGAIYIIFTHGIASFYFNKKNFRKMYLSFNMAIYIPVGIMLASSESGFLKDYFSFFLMVEFILIGGWIVRKYYRKIPLDYDWKNQ
ncbi:MAG: hypothetical protein COA73_15975 [Candidatus Hydrogenedentota bacterium]|nr:MAG: hypothetical protein COA73_15975 [Candidatus Hydrogenedentota bacterium]